MGKPRVKRHGGGTSEIILRAQKGGQYDDYRKLWRFCGDDQVLNGTPIQVNIELTAKCNLKCTMCYRSYENPEQYRAGQLSLETVRAIAAEARDLDVSSVWVTGGEPLLHPQFPEILECLSSFAFLDFWLVTNGLLLDKEASALICNSAVTWLSVSIDASREETYRKIRGGSLRMLQNNIAQFLDMRDELNKRLPLLRVTFVEQEDNKAEVEEFLDEWGEVADSVDIQSLVDYHLPNEEAERKKLPRTASEFHCPEPFRIVSVLPDGSFAPCCNSFSKTRSPFKASKDSISTYWNSDWHKAFAKAIKERRFIDECEKCLASFMGGGVNAI